MFKSQRKDPVEREALIRQETEKIRKVPGSGTSSGEGNGNLLQYSCQENSKDKGIWWASVHRLTKSQTPLNN